MDVTSLFCKNFGSHIPESTGDCMLAKGVSLFAKDFSDTKVNHLEIEVGVIFKDNVLGFEVPMNYSVESQMQEN